MRVLKIHDLPENPMDSATPIAGWKGGPVSRTRQAIIGDGQSENFRCNVVNFREGATTGWHTHDCDQILVVTSGTGHGRDGEGRARDNRRRRRAHQSRRAALARRESGFADVAYHGYDRRQQVRALTDDHEGPSALSRHQKKNFDHEAHEEHEEEIQNISRIRRNMVFYAGNLAAKL